MTSTVGIPHNSTSLDGLDLAAALALPSSIGHAAAVDAGGTRFRAWLATRDGTVIEKVEFKTRELKSLSDGLLRFLVRCGLRPKRLCLGVAGPETANGIVQQTNAPGWWPGFNWIAAGAALGIEIFPMNDMGVAALAMRRLKDDPAFNRAVLPGQAEPRGKILTVGIGTGLGDAYVDGDYVGQGEPGHHPFSPRDEVDDQLLTFSREELHDNIVSFEDVASGSKGLPRLYRFFQARRDLTGYELDRCSVGRLGIGRARQRRPPSAETMTRTGVNPHASGFDPVSFVALVRLGNILGTYIGARAVAVSATGGIRLVGGVLSAELIELWLRHSTFEQRIRNMGVHRPMADRFEVGWVSHPYPGLLGAIEAALQTGPQRPVSRA